MQAVKVWEEGEWKGSLMFESSDVDLEIICKRCCDDRSREMEDYCEETLSLSANWM